MYLICCIFTLVFFHIERVSIIVMSRKPLVPPSISEVNKDKTNTNFFITVLSVFKNPYFVLFLIVGGKSSSPCEREKLTYESVFASRWVECSSMKDLQEWCIYEFRAMSRV